MKPKLAGISYNVTHTGAHDKPLGGFRVSWSTAGKPIVPCIGRNGWRLAAEYLHNLVHEHPRTCRIWLEFEDGTKKQVWYYVLDWIDRKAVIDAGLAEALRCTDITW